MYARNKTNLHLALPYFGLPEGETGKEIAGDLKLPSATRSRNLLIFSELPKSESF